MTLIETDCFELKWLKTFLEAHKDEYGVSGFIYKVDKALESCSE